MALAAAMLQIFKQDANTGLQQQILRDMQVSSDAEVLYYFGSGLSRSGGANASVGNELISRAKAINPEIADRAQASGPGDFPPTPGVQRIRVGGEIQAAKLKNFVKAEYTPLALQARIQGVVRFSVLIGAEGAVKNLQLISGHPLLVPAASEALKQWTYSTTLLNGVPVEVVAPVDVNFTLAQ